MFVSFGGKELLDPGCADGVGLLAQKTNFFPPSKPKLSELSLVVCLPVSEEKKRPRNILNHSQNWIRLDDPSSPTTPQDFRQSRPLTPTSSRHGQVNISA